MTLTRRHLFRSFPLLLLALAATSARAADNYLKVIPSTALAWGAVNHIGEASDKIQKLAAIVQAPTVSVLEEIKKEWGLQKGLDEKGAAGFFVVLGKTNSPPWHIEKDTVAAAFVAVADEKEFLASFEVVKAGEKISEVRPKSGGVKPEIPGMKKAAPAAKNMKLDGAPRSVATTCLAFRNGYALLSPISDRAALEAAVEAKQDISAEMAGLESWLAENDGTIVGTAAGIKYAVKQAGEELKKSKDKMRSGDAEMPEILPSLLDFYGKVLAAAPSQLSLAVAGIRCDKQGSIRVIGRARLVKGGLVSTAVAGIPPVTENLFSGVPGGPFVVAEAGVNVLKLAEGYLDLAMGLLKGMKSVHGMSAEDFERIEQRTA